MPHRRTLSGVGLVLPPRKCRVGLECLLDLVARERCCQMVVSEGMELVIMFIVIMLNLLILVWLQKWSGLT